MRLQLLLVLLFSGSALSAQNIPPSRTTDWTNPGYRGVITSTAPVIDVTSQGIIGDSLTDNTAALNALIYTLYGTRNILYFPGGNYRFSSTILLQDSIVLRGAGSDSTHFLFNFNGTPGDGIRGYGSPNSSWEVVTAGYYKGSSYVVVHDSGFIQPGQWVEMRQDNGSWDTQPISWADYSVGQLMETTTRSGDTIYFNKPLRIDYDSTLNVRISVFQPLREVSIECISIERMDSVSCFCPNINLAHAVDCNISGVESKRSISAHVLLDASSNITIRSSYFHDAFEYNGSSMHGYGIALINHSGQNLIENNILKHLRHSLSFQTGANGNVTAYNFSLDPNRSEFPANFGADISMHGHYPYANLFEGNIVQNIQLDQTWGPSGPWNTFLRNRAELYGLLMSSGTVNTDNQNFIGNEISGTGAFQGNYTLTGAGHFEYGNNVRGTITPSGTTNLTDLSYYLTTAPAFWNLPTGWPSIGAPATLGSGTIPAKERYLSGFTKTLCGDQLSTGVHEAAKSTSQPLVYPNPVASGKSITIVSDDAAIIRLQLYDISGRLIRSVDHTPTNKIVLSLDGIVPGHYMLHSINTKSASRTRVIVQ